MQTTSEASKQKNALSIKHRRTRHWQALYCFWTHIRQLWYFLANHIIMPINQERQSFWSNHSSSETREWLQLSTVATVVKCFFPC